MGLETNTPQPDAPSLASLLEASVPEAVEQASGPEADATLLIRAGFLKRLMSFLKSDPRLRFEVLVDITAVDFLGRTPRFDIVYHLVSLHQRRRLCVKLRVDGEEPVVDSLTDLWASANWLEREVWDMFGIRFAGHPNLKRILLYEQFEGHPLRKDYPMRKRQPLIGPRS